MLEGEEDLYGINDAYCDFITMVFQYISDQKLFDGL